MGSCWATGLIPQKKHTKLVDWLTDNDAAVAQLPDEAHGNIVCLKTHEMTWLQAMPSSKTTWPIFTHVCCSYSTPIRTQKSSFSPASGSIRFRNQMWQIQDKGPEKPIWVCPAKRRTLTLCAALHLAHDIQRSANCGYLWVSNYAAVQRKRLLQRRKSLTRPPPRRYMDGLLILFICGRSESLQCILPRDLNAATYINSSAAARRHCRTRSQYWDQSVRQFAIRGLELLIAHYAQIDRSDQITFR